MYTLFCAYIWKDISVVALWRKIWTFIVFCSTGTELPALKKISPFASTVIFGTIFAVSFCAYCEPFSFDWTFNRSTGSPGIETGCWAGETDSDQASLARSRGSMLLSAIQREDGRKTEREMQRRGRDMFKVIITTLLFVPWRLTSIRAPTSSITWQLSALNQW